LTTIGLSEPMMFEPGSNWGYSHTNYTILSAVLEKITGKPMGEVMQENILAPMKLDNTASALSPAIPEPVLQAYSSERRPFLQIPDGIVFYEASTAWNPSWTTASGAVMTSDIRDLTSTFEIVGAGTMVSPEMYQQQVGNHLAGFGHSTESCPKVCRTLSEKHSYGLGVVLVNDWITQTMNFAGQGGSMGYLPAEKISLAVITTYTPEAFRPDGGYANASEAVMAEVAAAVTDHAPVAH
jgi:CubicO group peptidase (beta-lactamase class C family)